MKSLSIAIKRASRLASSAGVFLFLACGYLLPSLTRLATRRLSGRVQAVLHADAPAASGEQRGSGSSTLIVGGATAILLTLNSVPSLAGSVPGDHPASARHAIVAVNYADTLQGTQAMFAVRACSAEGAPFRPQVDQGAELPASLAFIHEQISAEPEDIVVLVFDVDGREVSRHDGPANVCAFARLAAAFVARVDPTGVAQ
jgi:hypothetical protein